MPMSRSTTTIALLVGTAATAAGLNLSVLGLSQTGAGQDSVEAVPQAEATALESSLTPLADGRASAEPVALVVADAAPGAVGVPGAETTVGAAPAEPTSLSPGQTTRAEPVTTGAPPTTTPATEPPATSAPSADLAPTTAVAPTTTRRSPATTRPPAPTTPPATTAPPPASQPPTTWPASTEILVDDFRQVASIEVAIHDGSRLELLSVTPVPGMAHRVEEETDTRIKIKFRPIAGGEESEWKIRFDDGDVRIDKER